MPWVRSQETYGTLGAVGRMSCVDRATMATLHQRHLKEVFHYVLRRVPRIEEAEEITAEVFAAASAALPRFRGQCPASLWLLSIARRQIALARRRAARRETLASELARSAADAEALWESLAAAEGPERAVMRAEAGRVLAELVSRLNADQREALMLHYLEELPVAEIAIVMGRSPGSVKGLLQRARAALYRQGHSYFLGEEKDRKP